MCDESIDAVGPDECLNTPLVLAYRLMDRIEVRPDLEISDLCRVCESDLTLKSRECNVRIAEMLHH